MGEKRAMDMRKGESAGQGERSERMGERVKEWEKKE